jgi:accessory secretory protein Asp3
MSNLQHSQSALDSKGAAGTGDKEIGTFYWGLNNAQTFMYGSEMTQNTVASMNFVNPLMPAGTTIHEWYSYTNYQLNRDIPILPFLYAGRTYRIEPDIKTRPDNTFALELLVFDRSEQMISAQVLYSPDYSFVYPSDSFYYTLRLINAGCDELQFNHFKLIEVNDEG